MDPLFNVATAAINLALAMAPLRGQRMDNLPRDGMQPRRLFIDLSDDITPPNTPTVDELAAIRAAKRARHD